MIPFRSANAPPFSTNITCFRFGKSDDTILGLESCWMTTPIAYKIPDDAVIHKTATRQYVECCAVTRNGRLMAGAKSLSSSHSYAPEL
jgi:hypothetical protein